MENTTDQRDAGEWKVPTHIFCKFLEKEQRKVAEAIFRVVAGENL